MSDLIEDKARILIVDDEHAIRDLLADMLADDYHCVTVESAEAALSEFERGDFQLVISDINLGGMSGVEMVPRIRSLSPDTVVMMISGEATIDTAIDAMRLGVFDYVRKPFAVDQVVAAVHRAIDHYASLAEKRRYEIELATLVEQRTAELHHLAHHDVLTGLPNEIMFADRLREILANSSLRSKNAVVLIGLSNLRAVRDTIGPAAANAILVDVTQRLRSMDPDAIIARVDGDKFACFITDTDSGRVVEIVNRILDKFKPAFVIDDQDIHAQTNIGISFFPNDATDHQSLIRNAGAALSQAEAKGTGVYQFYSVEMNARAVQQLALENNLRAAMDRDELTVVYQPKIEVATEQIVGMEALLRWNSPEMGPVPPDVFIPIAETTGLIIPIGEWVLRTACLRTKAWHDQGFPLHIAVNLSARQFQDDNLAGTISGILQATELDPNFLNLEVTETSVVTDPGAAVNALSALQKLGVSISIDDFGTGHSSLSHLRSLPIDVLKIDKTFIGNVTTEPDAVTLVKTMITLGHDLRLRVVAEGVETNEQLEILRELGCDEWQGYLRSKPLPEVEFDRMLRMKEMK